MSLTTDLKERVKGLCLNGCQLLLVKENHLVDRISRLQFDNVDHRVYILKVDEFDDLKAIDEEMMRKAGWVRADQSSEKEKAPLIHLI